MLEWLEQIDKELFLFLNGMHTQNLDFLMFWFSEELTWLPLYVVLLIALFKKYGAKKIIPIVICIALTITLTDQLSVKAFKNIFERYRPCHNIVLADFVHTVNNHCGGLYGFVSSHAANTFGLAALLSVFFKNTKITIFIIFWASVVSYSRIYLGVHYLSDVFVGAILGLVIGYTTSYITCKIAKL